MEEKDFDGWIEQKEYLHTLNRMREVHEREVWWCAVGENVGVEINGKSKVFSRPVLIFKKLSKYGFLGIPLTTRFHTGSWYIGFEFKDKKQYAALAQIRVLSTSRLYERIGMLPNSDYEMIKNGFWRLYR